MIASIQFPFAMCCCNYRRANAHCAVAYFFSVWVLNLFKKFIYSKNHFEIKYESKYYDIHIKRNYKMFCPNKPAFFVVELLIASLKYY